MRGEDSRLQKMENEKRSLWSIIMEQITAGLPNYDGQ